MRLLGVNHQLVASTRASLLSRMLLAMLKEATSRIL
jgi:hypothetical protein